MTNTTKRTEPEIQLKPLFGVSKGLEGIFPGSEVIDNAFTKIRPIWMTVILQRDYENWMDNKHKTLHIRVASDVDHARKLLRSVGFGG
jgi:hypothetical protein